MTVGQFCVCSLYYNGIADLNLTKMVKELVSLIYLYKLAFLLLFLYHHSEMFTEEKKTYHTSSHSSLFAKAFNSIVQLLKSSVDYFFKLEFYSKS